MAMKVDENNCSGCGTCEDACPVDALKVDDAAGVAMIDDETCIECGACADDCPSDAIEATD